MTKKRNFQTNWEMPNKPGQPYKNNVVKSGKNKNSANSNKQQLRAWSHSSKESSKEAKTKSKKYNKNAKPKSWNTVNNANDNSKEKCCNSKKLPSDSMNNKNSVLDLTTRPDWRNNTRNWKDNLKLIGRKCVKLTTTKHESWRHVVNNKLKSICGNIDRVMRNTWPNWREWGRTMRGDWTILIRILQQIWI